MSTPDRTAWAYGYAKQSRSDFALYQRLELSGEERCHCLHFLQMACEKIAKAYRFRDTATSEERLTTEHVAFSQFIDSFLASGDMKRRYRDHLEQLLRMRQHARLLAREIEKLAPAVDREGTPVNAEYPWQEGEQIVSPCEYGFPQLELLKGPLGRSFLKLVKVAIDDFEHLRIH
ncbi:MAG TPA: hypothetical protein VH877_14765 [Polyangia bacterium]|jgi:hypothetical protein|nr:hypothetical protein [Polyangia bacterium]